METLKKVKWDIIVSSVICIALGIILTVFPKAVNEMITYVLAAAMFVFAGIGVYNYFRKNAELDFYRNDLVVAVASLIIGILVLAKRDLIIAIIPAVLGVLIIASGVQKLQNAVDLARLKLGGWVCVLILSLINIVFGVIMVLNAFAAATVVTILIGVGLIYSGVTDLFSMLWVSRLAKKQLKALNEEK